MARDKGKLKEIAGLFLKLGVIAFGGPAAHIAMMEDEVVTRRKWMSRQHFLDLIGATNLIPGPNSTEMTMHCGHERAGWPELFVAGACFIFPAVILTGLLAFLYVEYGQVPEIEPFLYGIKPAVLAIILAAIYKLGKKALKSWQLGVIGAAVIAASFLGASEIAAILGAGVIVLVWFGVVKNLQGKDLKSILPVFLLKAGSATAKTVPNLKLFLNPIVPRLRRSKLASGFLDAVNIGAVGIMIAVTFRLGEEILIDWRAWLIALLSIAVTFTVKKAGPFWIVIGGALAGNLLSFV